MSERSDRLFQQHGRMATLAGEGFAVRNVHTEPAPCQRTPPSVKVVPQMQLSRFTDYALRVLIYAAARPDARCLTADVAIAFGISRQHLVKVVNELQHLGYLETVRGRDGVSRWRNRRGESVYATSS